MGQIKLMVFRKLWYAFFLFDGLMVYATINQSSHQTIKFNLAAEHKSNQSRYPHVFQFQLRQKD